MSSIDIFYKSYRKDFQLLKYSLMSLRKNVEGFVNIILVVPREDADEIIDLIGFFRGESGNINLRLIDEYGDGYLFQQVCKMNAWKYSKSDYILFADSDCIFDHPINLQDYVKDGKSEILYTPWEQVGDAQCWRDPTEEFMGEQVDFEFMRRNCLIYHRSTLEAISLQYQNLEEYIMSSGRFSEFNAIGAWAFKNEKEKYNFVNTNNWEYTPPLAIQLWSHFDKDGDGIHQEEHKRAIGTINNALNLNLKEL